MRITAAEKQATRERILSAALDLFRTNGFEATTTRDIATAAGIATGTLFNYFSTKEAVVVGLAEDALSKTRRGQRDTCDSLDEELFALVAAELRQLRPLRKFLAPVLETSLSPLAVRSRTSDALRVAHLEAVAEIARRHGIADLSPLAAHMYWTLYTGALAFWSADNSPKQEDTLALLDHSLAMFAQWLHSESGKPSS